MSAPELSAEGIALPDTPVHAGTPAPAPLSPLTNDEIRWDEFFIDACDQPYPTNWIEHHPPLPDNLSARFASVLTQAFNAGRLTGTGIPTSYEEVTLPRSSAAKQTQQRYFAIGLTSGINQRLAALTPA